MILRRITVTLPARMRATAAHDGRAIAEAAATALYAQGGGAGGAPGPGPALLDVLLDGRGQSGAALAQLAAARIGRGGRHGG